VSRVAGAVARYRKSEAAMRRLSGHTLATRYAKQRHQSTVDHMDSFLRDAGLDTLRGLLSEEAGLIDRLAGIPSGERPELRERLKLVRREVRKEVDARS
jgi:hypothetical protein